MAELSAAQPIQTRENDRVCMLSGIAFERGDRVQLQLPRHPSAIPVSSSESLYNIQQGRYVPYFPTNLISVGEVIFISW